MRAGAARWHAHARAAFLVGVLGWIGGSPAAAQEGPPPSAQERREGSTDGLRSLAGTAFVATVGGLIGSVVAPGEIAWQELWRDSP